MSSRPIRSRTGAQGTRVCTARRRRSAAWSSRSSATLAAAVEVGGEEVMGSLSGARGRGGDRRVLVTGTDFVLDDPRPGHHDPGHGEQ